MSDIDEVLRKRLDKLKGDISSSPKASTSGFLLNRAKSSAEQVEDLVAQLQAEISLRKDETEKVKDVDSHIRERLVRLKSRDGCDFAPPKSISTPKTVLKDELADEDFFNSSSCSDLLADLGDDSDKDSLSENSSVSDEELCIVCVKNKTTKVCFDCGDVYYCDRCYKLKHKDEQHEFTVYSSSQ